MTTIAILLLVPLLAGLGLLAITCDRLRRYWLTAATAIVAAFSVNLLWPFIPLESITVKINPKLINEAMMVAEAVMGIYVLYIAIKFKRPLIALLMLAQAGMTFWFEFSQGEKLHVEQNLFIDKFSIIMALINGLVGGLICLYALDYMKEFHESHKEFKDRRRFFFFVLFLFQSAMFGIIFANNLLWLYFFWEITTLCSFLLIAYKQNEESNNNSLRALTYNLMGGVGFAAAIILFFNKSGSIELSVLMQSKAGIALVPASLLCFAGITKSAQFPFSSWLLGAMVAPTPVSALLHSSTMVKAGVYIVLRMSPIMAGTVPGAIVAMVGAATFLFGSFAAITANDSKKVLAYSTVANLGLIVLCGGIGTYEALWAGILLIIFHAVAKCLLFLCVGVIEHKLHSRNIEDMSGMILSMPKMSIMVQIGIAGMFLAPFGMLISKWAVLKAVIDSYPLLTFFIVFGSAATLVFWVKWMGKLIEVIRPIKNVEGTVGANEWFALYLLAAATVLTCLFFPMISTRLIEPHVISIYGQTATMAQGNIVIMTIMMALVALFPLSFFNYGRRVKVMDAYLGGANVGGSTHFQGSIGQVQTLELNNYYFSEYLQEAKLLRVAVVTGILLLVALLAYITIF